MSSGIILAPSYSGKSFMTARLKSHSGLPLVDGDDVIAAAGAWPKEREWWRAPDARRVHVRHAHLIAEVFARNRDIWVAFWTNVRVLVPILRELVPSVEIHGLVLPTTALRRNWCNRERQIAAGVSGHSPRPWADVARKSEQSLVHFRGLKVPVATSWRELVKASGLYQMTERRLMTIHSGPAVSEPPLLEQCVVCGRIHRVGDHRPPVRRHYHWGAAETERVVSLATLGGLPVRALLHRTVCGLCLPGDSESLFEEGRRIMPERFRIPGSLNATLPPSVPAAVRNTLDALYDRLAAELGGVANGA